MYLEQTKYKNPTRGISGINNIVFNNDVILLCDTISGVVELDLLQIPTDNWSNIYRLYVIDNTNNASVNNITISAPIGYRIHGQQTLVLNVNSASVIIQVSSNGSYIGIVSKVVAPTLGIIVQEEGTTISPTATKINFTGQGATATAVGNDVTVNIPSSSLISKEEGTTLTANTTQIDYVGELVKATAVGDNVTVTIDTYDSGWKTMVGYSALKGYGFIPNNFYPKIRIIGRQAFIEGQIILGLADNLGSLITDVTQYPANETNALYTGLVDGYNTDNEGKFFTRQPIIPLHLRPEFQKIMTPNISFIRRIVLFTGASSKYSMVAPLFVSPQLSPSGTLLFAGLKYIESDGNSNDYPYSTLHQFVSKFETGDTAINYGTTYKNSYTGGVLQQIPADSLLQYGMDFDPRDVTNYGGFSVTMTGSWLINNSYTIDQIKLAFDNL